jgi:hypothetical protein
MEVHQIAYLHWPHHEEKIMFNFCEIIRSAEFVE